MEELIVSIQDEYEWKVILRTKIYTEEQYKELEEENKKLKEYNRRLKQGNDDLKEQNKKLKAQIEKMSWIWLASAAPMVINKEVKYKPWFKNWMPTYDGSDLFK